jgi:hypothetical protein
MTEVKHADLIRAVLDGKTVQFREGPRDDWDEYGHPWAIPQMILHPEWEWRLKPETVVQFCPVYRPTEDNGYYVGGAYNKHEWAARAPLHDEMLPAAVLRLELDPDNLSVISARTEAP